MKKTLLFSIALSVALSLTGCASSNTNNAEQAETTQAKYPLTIQNFARANEGASWEKKDQVFDQAPERIMANTRPAAELLLHLGLGDKIVGVGANFGVPDPSVEAEYKKLNILSDEYVGKEVTMGTNPDLVFGRGGLFENADWGVGTVDTLNGLKIKTYVLESSITSGTYDSIYKDIENIGNIFDVKDKADGFIKELKDKQAAIFAKLENIKDHKTFAYLHTNDPKELYVYPASDESFFNDAFSMIKLDNVFAQEKGDVSVETLIATDPDILILPKWDETDLNKVRDEMYANPKLSSMKAIKNKQIYIVDYNYLFGYSYNTIDGMEQLAKEIYPDLFK
ncbi:ABC transporter substrate-binding protein [Paenibacillus sp. CF384]|uniref:ABC transporter substrate-binding protein n=1 Tax=Paenibacillus sp. CF384 TaxID=1884382 RepID=UPI00089C8B96|nr:ABC transporter substrate-binding protein [Paenibacillus sp. CF384]SDX55272.1 iron complex transport system substrate-binding protein [Paenibacillus sp. CF384]